MGDEESRTLRDPLAAPPCPACGRPRATIAARHKVLGAWVPEWEVQPCRNPACPLYEPPDGERPDSEQPDGDRPAGERPDRGAPDTERAGTTTTQVTGKNGENGRSPATG
ncbi:hypothetical protein [Streptomyces griseus]|uniref:hypothetical protein n=1 Tax=Streptomyces griseus TaxID=1911 RepID=UPI0007C7203B|nr:hypothetical protein [Streptomyces griseus]